MAVPRIALTAGEPAGIGPDLCIQLAQHPHPAELVVLADPQLLRQRAAQIGLPLRLLDYMADAPPSPQQPGELRILAHALAAPTACGVPDPANADYLLATLRRAAQGCMTGEFAAMVTAPINKAVIMDAGHAFSGHTEYLAELTHSQPVMMLTAPGLRVALATTHLPLRAVPDAITHASLTQTLRILYAELRTKYRLAQPRILVLGLNPHAGESGHLGTEEQRVITPVVQQSCAEGMRLRGPLPADTAFTPPQLAQADAVLAMYHDQGLPVLKYLGFGRAVNVTLGLPIIRTSVDHGTAFDLAGSGRADPGSLEAALAEAIWLAGGHA